MIIIVVVIVTVVFDVVVVVVVVVPRISVNSEFDTIVSKRKLICPRIESLIPIQRYRYAMIATMYLIT